jgi:hypothetical protein
MSNITVSQANRALEQAQSKRDTLFSEREYLTDLLARVKQNPRKYSAYNADKLKQDLDTLQREYLAADRAVGIARAGISRAKEAEKVKVIQEQQLQQQEVELRALLRRNFPGNDAEFSAAYPQLKAAYQQQQTLSSIAGGDRARAQTNLDYSM